MLNLFLLLNLSSGCLLKCYGRGSGHHDAPCRQSKGCVTTASESSGDGNGGPGDDCFVFFLFGR